MIVKLPIKIGDKSNLSTYASTLTNGEEQLLITREGTLHLTDGSGSVKDIKAGLSQEEVQNLINPLTTQISELTQKIAHLETAVTNLGQFPDSE